MEQAEPLPMRPLLSDSPTSHTACEAAPSRLAVRRRSMNGRHLAFLALNLSITSQLNLKTPVHHNASRLTTAQPQAQRKALTIC